MLFLSHHPQSYVMIKCISLHAGGQEAVLVMWDAATGRRTYLPRLGGPLTGLASCLEDPAKYALRQADNTIRVVSHG